LGPVFGRHLRRNALLAKDLQRIEKTQKKVENTRFLEIFVTE
jgi:hypothetical protein